MRLFDGLFIAFLLLESYYYRKFAAIKSTDKGRKMTDIQKSIDSDAQSPKRVTVDGVTAEQRDLKDMIDADAYLDAKEATRRNNSLGIRIMRASSPGSQG